MKNIFGFLGKPGVERHGPAGTATSVALFPFAPQPECATDGLASTASVLNGVCPVCGEQARFERFTENLRESGFCSVCGSFNRQRQIAHLVQRRCRLDVSGRLAIPAGFAVYNTESNGAVHRALSVSPDYVCSEYFGEGYERGQDVDGCRNEDLQDLTFADASFDLVLSSDVLEHMPDPYRAHREIYRTLKPGGRHIFTVPFNSDKALDDIRAHLVDGEIVYLAEKLFHGDPVRPDQGILVWTIFGLEMLSQLARIGFIPSVWNLYEPAQGIVGGYSLVFEARRPDPS